MRAWRHLPLPVALVALAALAAVASLRTDAASSPGRSVTQHTGTPPSPPSSQPSEHAAHTAVVAPGDGEPSGSPHPVASTTPASPSTLELAVTVSDPGHPTSPAVTSTLAADPGAASTAQVGTQKQY